MNGADHTRQREREDAEEYRHVNVCCKQSTSRLYALQTSRFSTPIKSQNHNLLCVYLPCIVYTAKFTKPFLQMICSADLRSLYMLVYIYIHSTLALYKCRGAIPHNALVVNLKELKYLAD
jgi:hypothetical protein